MKNTVFYILLVSGLLLTACAGDSGSSSAGDYTDPGFTEKDISSAKYYSGIGSSCGPNDESCQVIIFTGKVNNTKYAGLAVKDGTVNLKIYWPASELTTGTGKTLNSCTVKLNSNTETNVTISNVTITNNNDDPLTYTITFVDGITTSTINIGSGASICGQVY